METHQARSFLAEHIVWFGQSTLLITTSAGKRIYIDPYFLPHNPLPADYVFFTHSHGDHYNPKALEKIRKPETRVIAPKDLAAVATDILAAGDEAFIGDIGVKAFPAYNRRGFPHPKSKGWLGYLLSFEGFRVLHAGDTDSWAELVGIKPDVAFLPFTGIATFNLDEGVKAATAIEAAITVPFHYGLVPGTKKNGEKFVRAYKGESAILNNALKG